LQPAGRGLGAPVIARSPLRWRLSKGGVIPCVIGVNLRFCWALRQP
jgi:hypothetical protein